ncbi:hypothetical protein MPN29_01040 [Riemerella anatipestifer]|uniref:hypothetical protein n=1 Tax=Riemerella anatipestifer TaxID=34085 RepID=UPI00236347FA|nr:hypothetical protein [Riemerella anatipestifer]WKV54311.1 hypothetical protein MPN29_01040 [Riemerella anatipestifer]WKV56444.1 hypothetical protein MWN58_01040 [Riemerella anatipestifer]WKV58576.1 hypothetical protein MWN59_01040 [Riemerella anatipestifer]
MEIPFYTSFKEFKDNYETDLEKWLSIYPDGNEDEFLKEVKELYEPFLRWNGNEFEELDNHTMVCKQDNGYHLVVSQYDSVFITKKQFKNLKFALPKIVNHIEYIINIKKSANVRLLGKVDPTTGKITPLKGDLPYNLSDEVTSTIEEQLTTTEEHEKTLTNPQKIKILDTLNIRGWLQDKDLTIFQIEILLSDLFGISTRSVRKDTSSDIHSDFAENYIKELKQKKAKR